MRCPCHISDPLFRFGGKVQLVNTKAVVTQEDISFVYKFAQSYWGATLVTQPAVKLTVFSEFGSLAQRQKTILRACFSTNSVTSKSSTYSTGRAGRRCQQCDQPLVYSKPATRVHRPYGAHTISKSMIHY